MSTTPHAVFLRLTTIPEPNPSANNTFTINQIPANSRNMSRKNNLFLISGPNHPRRHAPPATHPSAATPKME